MAEKFDVKSRLAQMEDIIVHVDRLSTKDLKLLATLVEFVISEREQVKYYAARLIK